MVCILFISSCGPGYYHFEDQQIDCKCFSKNNEQIWAKKEGYYQFNTQQWDKFYAIFTRAGSYCLKGTKKDRIIKLYGSPSIDSGDTLTYFMEERCLPDQLWTYCNVQRFIFIDSRLDTVALIAPMTKPGYRY